MKKSALTLAMMLVGCGSALDGTWVATGASIGQATLDVTETISGNKIKADVTAKSGGVTVSNSVQEGTFTKTGNDTAGTLTITWTSLTAKDGSGNTLTATSTMCTPQGGTTMCDGFQYNLPIGGSMIPVCSCKVITSNYTLSGSTLTLDIGQVPVALTRK